MDHQCDAGVPSRTLHRHACKYRNHMRGYAVGENSSRPGGLRAGSPPSPPPRSIRPTVRRLPRSPRLSGPGRATSKQGVVSALKQSTFSLIITCAAPCLPVDSRVELNGVKGTTRIGTINRDIEKNIKLVVSGSRGATGEAISSVKKRQALLSARPFKAKQPA